MNIIQKNANAAGAYSAIQSWSDALPAGYAFVPDKLDTAVFYEYNGFVTLTIAEDVVTAMVPNMPAWEAWKLEPPSLPTAGEKIAAKKVALGATDYKIIKCSECSLAGLPLPYDVAALHRERQAIRDEIGVLEPAK